MDRAYGLIKTFHQLSLSLSLYLFPCKCIPGLFKKLGKRRPNRSKRAFYVSVNRMEKSTGVLSLSFSFLLLSFFVSLFPSCVLLYRAALPTFSLKKKQDARNDGGMRKRGKSERQEGCRRAEERGMAVIEDRGERGGKMGGGRR